MSNIEHIVFLWQKHGLKIMHYEQERRKVFKKSLTNPEPKELYISIYRFTLLIFSVILTKQISRF